MSRHHSPSAIHSLQAIPIDKLLFPNNSKTSCIKSSAVVIGGKEENEYFNGVFIFTLLLLLTYCLLFLQYESERENRRKERKDMIVGVGIDIIEIERIEKMIEGQPKFIERILTENERQVAYTLKGKRRSEFVAGRFAAKEAYSKALGTGIGKEVSFLHIEIMNDERGKPILLANTSHTIHLSISHSREFAVAQVVLESPSS